MKRILQIFALLSITAAQPVLPPVPLQRQVLANEATAAQRRVYFQLVDATDGITPETGESGGQPQISVDGAAWTNTGIGTLTHIGNGRYYADLTQTIVATAGPFIETRYKSANTAEAPGTSVTVVGMDPYASREVLPRAVARPNYQFPMWSSVDGGPGTGLTVSCQSRRDGGALSATSAVTAVTGVPGTYSVNLTAGDMDGEVITIYCTAVTGGQPTTIHIITNH